MKLHAPGPLTDAESLMGIVRAGPQQHCAVWQSQYGLGVGCVGVKSGGQPAQQGIPRSRLSEGDRHCTNLAPCRVIVHMPAARMGQQLMAIADSQYGQAQSQRILQPVRRDHVPGSPVSKHGG
jgi:hypothetical protein